MLTVDGRELRGGGPDPVYGSAVSALLEGFCSMAGDVRIDVVSFAPIPEERHETSRECVHHWSLPIPKLAGARWAYAGRVAAIRSWLRRNPVDLVHAQGTERWCGWAASCLGQPYVLTIHGHVTSLLKQLSLRPRSYWLLQGLFERRAVACAEAVIALSISVRRAVAGTSKSTCLIPNAVSGEFFLSSPQRSERIVLQVGDILPGKRPLEMLLAMDSMPKDFQMVFLGWCPPGSRYAEDFVKEVACRPWSRIVAPGPRATVVDWLRRASVLVHPSVAENCPMAVLEAMAAGVPVVASAVGGIPDLLNDGTEGYLARMFDTDLLAARVHELLNSPELAQRMGADARSRGVLRHTPSVIAGQTAEIYRELLACSGVKRRPV